MNLFDFDDVLLTPSAITRINSRSEINPFDDKGGLPLFTAPMDTVVNTHNAHYFKEQGVNVILPRTVNTDLNPKTSFSEWISYGLNQFEEVFIKNDQPKDLKHYILLDVANGHMPAVHELTKKSKEKYGDSLVLMVGNVANPETYVLLSDAGADYVRIGIGNGCFIDGSMVTTIKGKKPIEDVIEGDLVMTHNRNYKEVANTKRFEYSGELIKINDEITCTPDHEFYVLPKKYLDIVTDDNIHILSEWVSATELYNNPGYLITEIDDYEKTNTLYKFKEINKIEKITDTVYVNDLSVLDDNSYIVNNACVHNCGCLTTQQTGVGYPMASLIVETYKLSCTLEKAAYIVADGGFKKYSDVIKALALGADYVMLGSIFNKALESAGETVDEDGIHVNQYNLNAKEYLKAGGKLFKKFRGMSTKEVQISWGKKDVKTSEGVVKVHAVEYTIDGWVDNFKHYLTSAMSYTDAKNLTEFIGRAKYKLITEASFKRFNK